MWWWGFQLGLKRVFLVDGFRKKERKKGKVERNRWDLMEEEDLGKVGGGGGG